MAAKGGWAAAKMAADPLKTARRAGNAVAGAAMGVAGAAVGAWEGTKSAFRNNQTLSAIFGSRNKNTGVKSERALKTGTSAGGSRVHVEGFGNRSRLESVKPQVKRDMEAPQLGSRPRLDDAPSLPKQMPGVKGRSRDF